MSTPQSLYAELVDAFQHGRWEAARVLATKLLPHADEHAGVHGIAGMVCLELQDASQAAFHFLKATTLDPQRIDFATLHAKALIAEGALSKAKTAADRALAMAPTDAPTLDTLGIIYTKAHAHERAAEVFAQAAAAAPDRASHRFNLANALMALGCGEAAENELHACIRLDPMFWEAYPLLAQLRRQPVDETYLLQMERMLSLHAQDRTASSCLNLAMSREHERMGRYDRAFEHLARSKISARPRGYSIERDRRMVASLIHAFQDQPPSSHNAPVDAPIFVVGMPRSGTTLVERIISSHPDVQTAGELQNFPAAVQRLSGRNEALLFSEHLDETVSSIDWSQLAAAYLAGVPSLNPQKRHFIDKLPHNFLYIGFIGQAFPQAKIICLRRDAMDTCLGNFRQRFDSASPHFDYSHDLLDIGRYYLLFDRLITHWKALFPDRILEVRYESLVSIQEAASRQMLAFCALPWNQACLDFQSNPNPVATFSAMQVRQPLHRSAIGGWRRYARQLEPLRSFLASAGVNAAS